MHIEIQDKLEAEEIIIALVARLSVIQARLREGKPFLQQQVVLKS